MGASTLLPTTVRRGIEKALPGTEAGLFYAGGFSVVQRTGLILTLLSDADGAIFDLNCNRCVHKAEKWFGDKKAKCTKLFLFWTCN